MDHEVGGDVVTPALVQQPGAEGLLTALCGARTQVGERLQDSLAEVGERLGVGVEKQRREVGFGVDRVADLTRNHPPRLPGSLD